MMFCSNQCCDVSKIRIQDDIVRFINDNNIEVDNKKDFDFKIIDLHAEIEELKLEKEKEYYNGFVDGIKSIIRKGGLCLCCEKNAIQSIHHIIPREYGGGNFPENLIPLCNKCHDKVENLTDALFKANNKFDIKTIRGFIINDGFPKNKNIYLNE